MPLYPCFAPLIGLVIDRALAASRSPALARMWRVYFTAAAGILVLTGTAVLAISSSGKLTESPFSQSIGFASIYAALAASAAWTIWRARNGDHARRASLALLALAAFLGLTFTGLMMNGLVRRTEDVAGNVAALKRRLPPGTRLVSFGRAHHPFVYHYGETIPWLDWPAKQDSTGGEMTAEGDYFCFHSIRGRRKPLPFEWEEIDAISCDRYRRELPVDAMVIGRRLRQPQTRVAERP